MNAIESFWYWQCVGCERIIAGGKELPTRCTECDSDCWRSPPMGPLDEEKE